MVAHVVLDGTALVLTADDRIAQVVIEDLRLESRVCVLGDAPPEDDRNLVRAADRTVEVQEALVQAIEPRAAFEDQVRAVFDLADEQAITEALATTFGVGEKGNQLGQPAMGTSQDVRRSEGVGKCLQPGRVATGSERIAALLEGDVFLAQAAGEPLVAIETDTSVEREIRADAQEHPAKILVLHVEVILPDKTVAQLDVVALLGKADGHTGILAAFQDHRDAWAAAQVLVERLHPVFPSDIFRRFHDRDATLLGQSLDEVMIVSGDRLEIAGGQSGRLPFVSEKADHTGGVL